MRSRTTYTKLTASGQVLAGEGWLAGMYVNTTTTGSIALYDYLEATGDTLLMFNASSPSIGYHSLGNVHCTTGCYADLGAAADVTFLTLES